jgi:hypothetical protein
MKVVEGFEFHLQWPSSIGKDIFTSFRSAMFDSREGLDS